MDQEKYREHWQSKKAWYDEHSPGKLMTTMESPTLSPDAEAVIRRVLGQD